jgi:hypothetical protein
VKKYRNPRATEGESIFIIKLLHHVIYNGWHFTHMWKVVASYIIKCNTNINTPLVSLNSSYTLGTVAKSNRTCVERGTIKENI